MCAFTQTFNWIETQGQAMRDLAVRWSGINSHTFNSAGLEQMLGELAGAFAVLKGDLKRVPLADVIYPCFTGESAHKQIADALVIQKRPQAPKQALLVCHVDTVYPRDHSFQNVKVLDHFRINGPGIADAKGGIVVMLKTLEALEHSPLGRNLGWTVIINTDEEIGSPSSLPILLEHAKRCQLGLVFEPCLPNGRLVGARKGSANFTLTATGKSAHAGRDITQGRNAVEALARCIPQISALSGQRDRLTVNVGVMHGGTVVNVVPERANAACNIRFMKKEDFDFFESKLHRITAAVAKDTQVNIACEGQVSAVPKPMEGKTLDLFKHVQKCGRELGLDIQWEDSGGVCDGNRLQAAGLPVVDTLGVQAEHIHSDQEFFYVNSLAERTKLATLTLLKWAGGEWDL